MEVWGTLSNAQGLLWALYQGSILVALEDYMQDGGWIPVGFMQGEHATLCTIRLASTFSALYILFCS